MNKYKVSSNCQLYSEFIFVYLTQTQTPLVRNSNYF